MNGFVPVDHVVGPVVATVLPPGRWRTFSTPGTFSDVPPAQGEAPQAPILGEALLLREAEVPFAALCVVNRDVAKAPREVYRFLADEVGTQREVGQLDHASLRTVTALAWAGRFSASANSSTPSAISSIASRE